MARGMNVTGLLQYTTAFLRLCQRRECGCGETVSCGFDHYPCGWYGPKHDDGTNDQLPQSQLRHHCYCPRVLSDVERLLILITAQHGGEIYYKLENIGEMIARSTRSMSRIVASLERKTIVQQLTCKQAHCTSHHRSRHIRLSLQLPGMDTFEEMERLYMNLARARKERE